MKKKTFSNSIVRTVMLVNTAPIRVFVDDELRQTAKQNMHFMNENEKIV